MMSIEEVSALHSNELIKLPHDPSDLKDDIWQLSLQIRILREQVDDFKEDYEKLVNQQLCILEALLSWCDSLLYQSCELYCKHSKIENDTPEGP